MQIFIVFILSFAYVYGAYKFPDMPKCKISDNECLGNMYKNNLAIIAERGIPELNLAPVDPMNITGMHVSILGQVDLNMESGVAKGVKKCSIENFSMDLAAGKGSHDVKCKRIHIEGIYSMTADSELIESVLGNGRPTGHGNAKVIINDLLMTFRWPIKIEKGSDGETYFICDYKKTTYDYKVGGAKFNADGIILNGKDISKQVVGLLNESWEFIMTTFGRYFMDKAVKISQHYLGTIFGSAPTSNFVTDDLTPYVKS